MRVILTTGGTGGHVFPALAVAEVLRTQGVECLFVGSQYGPEARWAAQAGIEFAGLPVRGVLGRGFKAIAALGSMGLATFRAVSLIKKFRPDLVAGFGAYASCAPLMAAAIVGVPSLIHEQNAFPGLTNRMLSKLAKRVCLSMNAARPAFDNAKCVLTGNPVRAAMLQALSSPAGAALTAHRDSSAGAQLSGTPYVSARRLLVVGGSQGARAVNSIILAGLARLSAANVHIRHQTGTADFERVTAGYAAFGLSTEGVSIFIDDMARAYAEADVVLCRAGASTVAELAVAGKAACFVPFPYATHDHQTYNAKAVCDAGAGILLPEAELGTRDAIGELIALLEDPQRLATMGQAARERARPDAAECVAREIMELAR